MSTSNPTNAVVFENSLGETISNDPVFHAHATLVAQGFVQPEVDEDVTDEDDSDAPRDLKAMSVDSLKVLAREEGVELTGIKKKSELVALLESHFTAQAADAESDED